MSSYIPQSYLRTGRKAKDIVAKMLNAPEQLKSMPIKLWNQYNFLSKLARSEAVGRSGGVTAFYKGNYEIKVKLDKEQMPFIGQGKIDVAKLQTQIMEAIEDARRNNHIHKYYEKSNYEMLHDNSLKPYTFSKGVQYATQRADIKKDFTLAEDDDENQYMFKKTLQKLQQLELDFIEDMRDYKKYLVKKQDEMNMNLPENERTEATFTTTLREMAAQASVPEAQKQSIRKTAFDMELASSSIMDYYVDENSEALKNIELLTYDSRLDPDAEPIGPFLPELLRMKETEKMIAEYESEHGKGSFEKYMTEAAGDEISTAYGALESLDSIGSPSNQEKWIRVLFDVGANESVDEVVQALNERKNPTSISNEADVETKESSEQQTSEEENK
ncbi:hypothetical protein C9374_006468 [Naegleria lovaniensis]|uniref:Uncharacterized protein n=1 Tax=Naegleria lovaniensis TaxID=51637 RepID=A0AA88GI95_NAELO|nr:uncharacterized protein C9374_006468 [Naegleria lovaniensis]KAG2381479.1 hypothetical protein C9374_006468 [Naegleria lovaniensis]